MRDELAKLRSAVRVVVANPRPGRALRPSLTPGRLSRQCPFLRCSSRPLPSLAQRASPRLSAPLQNKATVHQLGMDLWRDVVVRNRRIRERLLGMLLDMVQVGWECWARWAAGQRAGQGRREWLLLQGRAFRGVSSGGRCSRVGLSGVEMAEGVHELSAT